MADGSLTTIIVRSEARARGLKRYFTGKPCKRGHVAERMVANKACYECLKEDQARWRRENPRLAAERDRRQNERRDPDARAAWLRAARKKNPKRYRDYDRLNYEKNKAAGSEYQKRRYARRDKEAASEANAKWKRENPDKVREHWVRTYQKNKAKHHAKVLRWNAQNPEKVAARRDRRRAWKEGAEGSYTETDIAHLVEASGGVCFYCGSDLESYHIDHFIPLSRGGSNWPDNLRLSCPSCNCSKSAKMPWEWMPERFSEP